MGTYNSSPKTLADGEQRDSLLDSSGRLITVSVGSDGASGSPLPAGTDRSGTAATTEAQIVAANAARRGLEIQNIGANNIGINEFGNAAAIGTAGTYTLTPNSSMRIRTNRAVRAIAATASTAFTATEW